MAAIEVTAPDVEHAIAQGLQQLDLIRAEVKIEVLDEGSRGVLGIGAKPARVRLTPYIEVEAAAAAALAQATPAVDDADENGDDDVIVEDVEVAGAVMTSETPADGEEPAPKIEGEDLALNIVRTILDGMGFKRATSTAHSVFPMDSDDEPSIWIDVDVEERDEELFLGHHNEGLNAMQTIVQTMWSHQTKSSLRVNLDVNGYRAEREEQLINMAHRMAKSVVASGKPIMLEPMRANERRIVHMALRDDPAVFTESTGEGASRKIQIKLKP